LNTVVQEKIIQYKKSHSSDILFLHTDKTVYTNNEQVWFSAYLVNVPAGEMKRHTILSVFLSNNDNRKIAVMVQYKMDKGSSNGALTLPDTIAQGNYTLTAYTDLLGNNGQPLAVFSAPLVVKTLTRQAFTSSVKLLDTVITNGMVRAIVTVNLNDSKPKVFPTVTYSIGNGFLHSAVIKNKELEINIPRKQLTKSCALLATVKYNGEAQYLSIKLPSQYSLYARFFPEGGNLADGLLGTVAWEVTTGTGMPVAVTGILFKDGQAIDTIATDSCGAGVFTLKPDKNSIYTLKVKAGSFLNHDTLFTLPKVSQSDIALHIGNAVANDTLTIDLVCKEKTRLQILVRNNLGAYSLFKVQASAQKNSLRLPLDALPKGIATITVLDDSGRPLAERLLFAHYNKQLITVIQIEKKTYGKKDSVKAKIKITDRFGKPEQSVFSIAAVQDNLITSYSTDITSYIYLNHDLGPLPGCPSGPGISDKEYLENMLLTKGWRRYTWEDFINRTQDSVQYSSPVIAGTVKYHDKPVKAPVQVIAVGNADFGIVTTASDGSFTLQRDQLITRESKKIALMVAGKNSAGYAVEVNNPFVDISRGLAERIEPLGTGTVSNNLSTGQELAGLENMHALQTVTIKGNAASNNFYGRKGEAGANDCGDYVDSPAPYFGLQSILNYPFTPRTRRFKPIPGQIYVKRTDVGYLGSYASYKVEWVTYQGCPIDRNESVLKLDGIYGEQEFYGVNDDPGELQYLSTLFWKPGIQTDARGEAEIQFKTGDIQDTFRIVVQGVTGDDVIYGAANFTVK